MLKETPSKSRTLRGISDLTLVAPIRRGLVPAPDARSYETRLGLLLRTLNTLRYASLEVNPAPAIPDMIDRIRAIHSFRLAMLDGPAGRQLLLSVAFDGGWEPYMRRIWRDLGPLLDVIFCNCEGYLLSHDHPYPAYAGWVRGAQLNTDFFYTASPVTVNDLHWLRGRERTSPAPSAPATDAALAAQALPGLAALYRLTELYTPGTPDGDCLLRAARHLLEPLWLRMTAPSQPLPPASIACRTPTERAAVAWFAPGAPAPAAQDAQAGAPPAWHPANTQGGIVQRQPRQPTHGCLLLLELEGPAAAAALIRRLDPARLSAQAQDACTEGPWFNLYFTLSGLRQAGVPDGHLACLPPEFLEGMEARAAVLGDLECNHPQQWALPERNWPPAPAGAPPARVALSSVHAVVQILAARTDPLGWQPLETHPLHAEIEAFAAHPDLQGVRLLSVEPMHRNFDAAGQPREHFGFADGLSNPGLPDAQAPAPPAWDRWALGDYLLGHRNAYGDAPLAGRFWTDSSFLVVRKLQQDVAALERMLGEPSAGSEAAALMIGRRQDGRNLVDGTAGNGFDYAKDPEGAACPLHSHVRRANPRVRPGERDDMKVLPRIIRRGMSYGPPYRAAAPGGPPDTRARGVMFMAYNASIAEQFELIQSWLTGSNSGGDGSYSGQRDPIFAVPRDGDCDRFGFGPGARPAPITLPRRPPVTLQWGLYLFVPSIAALQEMLGFAAERSRAAPAAALPDPVAVQRATEAKKGAVIIGRLQAVEAGLGLATAREQWKAALEDLGARLSGLSQCLWTAVRELHGGVLRTPYGVLVGSDDRVMEVFDDPQARYTVGGYCPRMASSFGRIYLGLDRGRDYDAQSKAANEAILAVTRQQGFDAAFRHTAETLSGWRATAGFGFDVKDLVDAVLAPVSAHFFGLPDAGGTLRSGAWQAQAGQAHADQPSCPGHFLAPSRYMFQPNPGEEAARMGQDHGKALKDYVEGRLKAPGVDFRRANTSVIGSRLAGIEDDAQYASTLIGIMMGFLPTVDGNLRSALYEWVNDRSLWDLQIAWRAGGPAGLDAAQRLIEPTLRRTMQLRPVPELVWRTATTRHCLGAVEVQPGERIVVGIVSAMQQKLMAGDDALWPVFGGRRAGEVHPTHACPGYEMAMGVMLGLLAGLLEAPLRPTLSATVLQLG